MNNSMNKIIEKFREWLIARAMDKFLIGGYFEFWCYKPDGSLRWYKKTHNIYTIEGITYILTTIFKGGTRVDPLYVGLNATNTPAAGWTMANNGTTWTESVIYSQATRQEFIDGAITSGTLSNSGNEATFTINNTGTIYGAFISTGSAKSGTTGSLICSCNFTEGSRAVVSGDSLKSRYTVGAADDGV
jgi:hypothetical protein